MSIFNTTANTELNSFSDPFNPANMNPGQWGVNPNYLTPSYSAPFRPRYGGGNGGWSNPNQPGLGRSVGNFINPLATGPMYGSPYNNDNPYAEQIHGRPMDAAMWANQRIVVPATSLYLSYKLGNIMTSRMNGLGGSLAAATTELFGGSVAAQAQARATQGIFSAIGDRFAQGTVSGMFGAARVVSHAGILGNGVGATAFRVAAAEGAGLVGGLAAGLLLPAALGLGAASAFSRVAVDPFIAQRRTSSDLRRNFANVNVAGGEDGGNVFTGQGMSFGSSTRIGGEITRAGIRDFTFNEGQFSQIADYSGRAGLLDDATIGQISKKVKNIANQVKMVMRIANEPDIKAAIEMLARLGTAGASVSTGEAGRALNAIGANSAIAGISTQRMMNTVGAQGQYMFAANGMTPYMGQIAASSNMATFASAYRQGVISPTLMAVMGGAEGATQSSLTAQVNGSQTMYNRIVMANRYMGNFTGQGVVGNLNAFGQNFSRNPIGAYGEMMMNSGLMASRQFAERGSLALQDQVMDLGRNIPGMIKRNGRMDAANAYTLMTGQMGLSHTDAFAYIQQVTAAQNPKVQQQMIGANQQYTTNQMAQQLEQMGLGYGTATPLIRGARNLGQRAIEGAWSYPRALMQGSADLTDWALSKYYGFKYHGLAGGGDLGGITGIKDLYKIQRSGQSHGYGVTDFLKNPTGNNRIPDDWLNDAWKEIDQGSYGSQLESAFNEVGGGSPLESIRKIQAAKMIVSQGSKLDTSDPETRKLMAIIGADSLTAKSKAGEIVGKAGHSGTLGFGDMFGLESVESIRGRSGDFLTGQFKKDYQGAVSDRQRDMLIIASARSQVSDTRFDPISDAAKISATPEELLALSETANAGAGRKKRLVDLAKGGRIDASSFTMNLAANTMLEASLNIKEAANIITGKPVGATPDSGAAVSGTGMFPAAGRSGGSDTRRIFSNNPDKNRNP